MAECGRVGHASATDGPGHKAMFACPSRGPLPSTSRPYPDVYNPGVLFPRRTGASNMGSLLTEIAERASRYLDGLNDRPVVPTENALRELDRLGGPLPETGEAPAEVLAKLDEVGSPATVATAGRRYFGFVIGSGLPVALAANWLASAWNQNAAIEVMSPVSARLERVALEWVRELLGLPSGARGAFVTGDTLANFTGLAAGRHAVLAKAGWDVERDGLFGAPPVTVVVGEEVHISVLRALSLLGLGRDRLLKVPTDEHGRMRADALPVLKDPAIVCLQAGNVNTGSFDPAKEICEKAHAAGMEPRPATSAQCHLGKRQGGR